MEVRSIDSVTLTGEQFLTGEVQGKPVTLAIVLGSVTAGMTPVVATCESIAFQSQMVTLELGIQSRWR